MDDMGEEEERKEMSSLGSQKKKRRKSLFEWTKEEEVKLLKMLVEFDRKKMDSEIFYSFMRNGSFSELPRVQISEKIQQLRKQYLEKKLELRKMRIQYLKGDDDEREESFELSNQLWGNVETANASTFKALDACSRSHFEEVFESHGLDIQLFTSSSFLDATKKDINLLFSLQIHHLSNTANMNAQLAKLKYDLVQASFNNPTNQ